MRFEESLEGLQIGGGPDVKWEVIPQLWGRHCKGPISSSHHFLSIFLSIDRGAHNYFGLVLRGAPGVVTWCSPNAQRPVSPDGRTDGCFSCSLNRDKLALELHCFQRGMCRRAAIELAA